jgi:hypothetical protein
MAEIERTEAQIETYKPLYGSTKPSNPKQAFGDAKLPLALVPDVIPAYASLGFLEGALKYGQFNWRAAGVSVSTYISAARRHLAKYNNGEWADQKTGVPHLASVLACVGIILDAHHLGKLTDDRPPASPMADIEGELAGLMPHLKEMFKDYNPKQWTIHDEINDG